MSSAISLMYNKPNKESITDPCNTPACIVVEADEKLFKFTDFSFNRSDNQELKGMYVRSPLNTLSLGAIRPNFRSLEVYSP